MKQYTRQIEKFGLSIPETAEAAGVGRTTIYNEINAGRLKSYKVGRRRLVSPTALRVWIESREQSAA